MDMLVAPYTPVTICLSPAHSQPCDPSSGPYALILLRVLFDAIACLALLLLSGSLLRYYLCMDLDLLCWLLLELCVLFE